MCYMSGITCHVSHVPCQVSHVKCHMSGVSVFFLQSVEARWWRVFYQWGLPRLVYYGSRKKYIWRSFTLSLCHIRPSLPWVNVHTRSLCLNNESARLPFCVGHHACPAHLGYLHRLHLSHLTKIQTSKVLKWFFWYQIGQIRKQVEN